MSDEAGSTIEFKFLEEAAAGASTQVGVKAKGASPQAAGRAGENGRLSAHVARPARAQAAARLRSTQPGVVRSIFATVNLESGGEHPGQAIAGPGLVSENSQAQTDLTNIPHEHSTAPPGR